MRCPACGFDNLTGSDICDNCGADLAGRDVPEPATQYRGPLLGEHLDELMHELNVGEPDVLDVSADADRAVQAMHEKGRTACWSSRTGASSASSPIRDAVLKVAGKPPAPRPIADLMTRDPVVLRHDDTIAVAINKMAVGGFRHIPIVEDGVPTGVVTARATCSATSRRRSTEGARRSPVVTRVLVLADDLIWSTRLIEQVRAAGRRRRTCPDAGGPQPGPAGCGRRDRGPDRPRLRRRRRGTSGCRERSARARGRQHDDATLRRRALDAGADRVLAYRKLFDDGPESISRWLASPAESRAGDRQ